MDSRDRFRMILVRFSVEVQVRLSVPPNRSTSPRTYKGAAEWGGGWRLHIPYSILSLHIPYSIPCIFLTVSLQYSNNCVIER